MWLSNFPRTVFGLSPKSLSGEDVHHENSDVFANISLQHVLVETDAPRLKLGLRGWMTPWSTYTILKWLTGVRQMVGSDQEFGEVVRDVETNFWRFFRYPESVSLSSSLGPGPHVASPPTPWSLLLLS